uniref:Phorbol-ester/DAG-type domain-containing protein n=1 Tax=Anopheles epiroticus TaxID=199890 RepID=A0A182PNR0_9DIPT
MKCAACKIIAHASCISMLMERSHLQCKPTFRDVGVRQYREQTKTTHHWVHRRTEKGKCKQCGKVSATSNALRKENTPSHRLSGISAG